MKTKTSRRTLPSVYAASARCPAEVRQYLDAALASNTLMAYRSDLRHFAAWGGKVPAAPEMIAHYVAHYAKTLATSTLSRRLVAIAHAHTQQGLASPTTAPLVRATLKGIRRAQPNTVRQVDALQKTHIVTMLRGLKDISGRRDSALLMLGFAGAFRRSELVSLDVEDICITAAGTQINLARSKTDQEGHGRAIAIPRMRGRFCPTHLLEAWLDAVDLTSGPVFRRINRYGYVMDERLSGHAVAVIIKQRASDVGLDPERFSGHSLRSGFVTNAATRGVSLSSIRQQTGHQSDQMVQRYIRKGQLFTDNALSKIW